MRCYPFLGLKCPLPLCPMYPGQPCWLNGRMVEHFSPVPTPLHLQPILSLYTVAWPMFRLNWSEPVSAGLSSHLYSKQSFTATSGSKLWYLPANQHFYSWQDSSHKVLQTVWYKKKNASKKTQTDISVTISFGKWTYNHKFVKKKEQCPFSIKFINL